MVGFMGNHRNSHGISGLRRDRRTPRTCAGACPSTKSWSCNTCFRRCRTKFLRTGRTKVSGEDGWRDLMFGFFGFKMFFFSEGFNGWWILMMLNGICYDVTVTTRCSFLFLHIYIYILWCIYGVYIYIHYIIYNNIYIYIYYMTAQTLHFFCLTWTTAIDYQHIFQS